MSEQPEKQPKETFESHIATGKFAGTPRCQSLSKRSRKQCNNPAVRGAETCRMHGGKGSGAPKGNVNRATPGSPRSKYKSVQQQRIELEMLRNKDVSEVVEILLRNHAAKSLLATKCRELNDVEVTQVSEPAEDSDDPDNGIKAEVIDYDKVARDESMAVARLAGSWTQIKRVEEPSAGDAGADTSDEKIKRLGAVLALHRSTPGKRDFIPNGIPRETGLYRENHAALF